MKVFGSRYGELDEDDQYFLGLELCIGSLTPPLEASGVWREHILTVLDEAVAGVELENPDSVEELFGLYHKATNDAQREELKTKIKELRARKHDDDDV